MKASFNAHGVKISKEKKVCFFAFDVPRVNLNRVNPDEIGNAFLQAATV